MKPLTLVGAVSPWRELGAYEALWSQRGASFKTIAEKFAASPGAVPSDFVSAGVAEKVAEQVVKALQEAQVGAFGVRVHGSGEYPKRLRDAHNPIEFLYYQGWWDLVNTPCVAVVGTRSPSPGGIARTAQIVRELVRDGFTVVSGLAAGIDTVAHQAAMEAGGRTIGVIGTPLSQAYPPGNADLQRRMGREFLLISQVPVLRYSAQHAPQNKFFFPARNVTMSALSMATIIVEAGETSGTLTQARAAIDQGRLLFILDSCFQKPSLTWPERFEKEGAIRVREYEDIRRPLVAQIQSN